MNTLYQKVVPTFLNLFYTVVKLQHTITTYEKVHFLLNNSSELSLHPQFALLISARMNLSQTQTQAFIGKENLSSQSLEKKQPDGRADLKSFSRSLWRHRDSLDWDKSSVPWP